MIGDQAAYSLPQKLALETRFITSERALLVRRPACTYALLSLHRLEEWDTSHARWLLIEILGNERLATWALQELARRGLINSELRPTQRGQQAFEWFGEEGFSLPPIQLVPVEIEASGKSLRRLPADQPVSDYLEPSIRKAETEPVPMFYDLRSLSLGPTGGALAALIDLGYRTTEDLLEAYFSPLGRETLAEVEIAEDVLRTLVSRADLMRVRGIGTVYATLLQLSGVESVDSLMAADPWSLSSTLSAFNDTIQISRRPPSAKRIDNWIAYSEQLPRYS